MGLEGVVHRDARKTGVEGAEGSLSRRWGRASQDEVCMGGSLKGAVRASDQLIVTVCISTEKRLGRNSQRHFLRKRGLSETRRGSFYRRGVLAQ